MYIAISLGWLAILGIGYVIFSLVRVWAKEQAIKQLEQELNEKIVVEEQRAVATRFMQGRIMRLRQEYKPRIEILERDRKYILDKLLFIHK